MEVALEEPRLADEGRGLAPIASELPDVGAACDLLRTTENPSLIGTDWQCHTKASDSSAGWVLLELTDNEWLELWHLAIRSTSGWTLFRPLLHVNPRIWGSTDSAQWSPPQTHDLLPGGEPELVFRFSRRKELEVTYAPGENHFVWMMQLVCARQGAAAQCTRPILDEYVHTFLEDEEIERFNRYRATVTLGADVQVGDVTGESSLWSSDEHNTEALVLSVGAHSLVELLAPARP